MVVRTCGRASVAGRTRGSSIDEVKDGVVNLEGTTRTSCRSPVPINGERGKSTSGPQGWAQDATGIHTKHAREPDVQWGLFPEGFNYKKCARGFKEKGKKGN